MLLQPEDFQSYVGGAFLAHLPEGGDPVCLELRSVRLHPERAQTWLQRVRPFTLNLAGPAARALRPGTYELSWPDGSRREAVFIQIVMGSGPHGAFYEAAFS